MAQTIKLKRSATSGAVPTTGSLELGEVAINTYDGKMYIKKDDGTEAVVQIGDTSEYLPLTGGTLTGNLNFGDNDKAVFGAGSDLQIYHDGAHSRIAEVGTGDLTIRASSNLFLQSADNENYLKAVANGATTIYHNNVAKLATTSTGIDVTGTVAATGGTLTGNLILRASLDMRDDSATASRFVNLPRSGGITFYGDASINHSITSRNQANGATDDLLISSYGAVYVALDRNNNNTGAADFVITKNGTTDEVFRVSGETGNVGIGTSSPARELHISKDGQNGVRLTSTVFGADFGLLSSVGGQNGFGIYDYNASGYRFNIDSSGNVGIGTSSPSEALDVNGKIVAEDGVSLGGDGSYGGYGTLAFSGFNNGHNRIFGGNTTSSGLYLCSATGRGIYFRANGGSTTHFTVDTSGNTTSSASSRAPIFYDSGNTGNYLDSPTSSVFRLNGSSGFVLSANGSTIVTGNSGGIDVTGTATADVLEAQGGSYSAATDSVTDAGIILNKNKPIYSLNGSHLRNLLKLDGSNNIVLGQGGTGLIANVDLHCGSSGLVRFYTSGLKAQITSTGAVQGASFDDYNNTSYFLDPGNTNVSLNAAGDLRSGLGTASAPGHAFASDTDTGMYRPASNVLGFSTGGTLRMQINSVGTGYWYGSSTTSTTNANLVLKGSVDTTTGYQPQNYHVTFQDGGGTVRGSISSSHYATIYSTSSDYRLKEDLQPIANATSRLMALNPVNFRWVDGQQRSDGFIAHELAEAGLPEAVTGTKDAVDADGNPEYQGIDQSKLVPLLVKTIQELEARITALESA